MTIWQVANGQSIQAAIVGAADGDTIVVGAGVYTENLTIDKAVTIVGCGAFPGCVQSDGQWPASPQRGR